MQIVGRSEDYTSDNATLNPPIVEGQKNPMRRDTVQVPSGTSVTLRVIADNPGAWFFHCACHPFFALFCPFLFCLVLFGDVSADSDAQATSNGISKSGSP